MRRLTLPTALRSALWRGYTLAAPSAPFDLWMTTARFDRVSRSAKITSPPPRGDGDFASVVDLLDRVVAG